ncbi:MAG: hypothetical protein ABI323_10095 [Solirubrobacteraceae bacterium]
MKRIAAQLARSPDAVVARRQTLGIAPRRRPKPWSPREESLLRAGTAAGLSASLLAGLLDRSTGQVRAGRRTLAAPRPPGRPYLAREDEAIRNCLAARGNLVALAGRLGRSPDALRLRAQQLGIYRPPPRRRWTDWEDALIRDGYTGALACAEITRRLPHRSAASVSARARKLGLATYARRWSPQDDQRLAHLTARGTTLEDVAQRLGRTPEAIRRRAARLGAKPPAPAPAPRRARHWTGEEDELLRLHHALNPARLAELLGRSDAAACRRLSVLGLRVSAQRSPHHPVSRRNGLPTPGELAVLERELPRATPRHRLMILRRLEHSSSRARPRVSVVEPPTA